ncbi:MAG TPA: 50S ribosomal protein L25 [Candidatus Polarisedimenticolia bacterium]|jgi:large subunit ribosomal protein L25|nr:50S ribosomal protein L25 [Candidatus Polarisedimenticolia bacterium]
MAEVMIDVSPRTEFGKNPSRRLRRAGMIPGIVYGSNKPPVPISVDPKQVEKILRSESGANSIFMLNLVGKDQRRYAMIKAFQTDPVSNRLQHTDFIRIQMDEVVQVNVPIQTVGEAPGVKLDLGILDIPLREIRIESLPADIPDAFKVDISSLKIGDTIRVADLNIPPKVKILTDPNQTVAVVAPPAKEEEVGAPVVAEVTEPEVIKKGKAASEEGGEAEEASKETKPEKRDSKKEG